MKTYAFIFARGGSKGLSKKNIKRFNGLPLISHTIEFALNNKLIDKVFVSSEDNRILNISKKYNVEIIKRPKKLATDSSPEILSWKHAVKTLEKKNIFFDKMLILPTTCPLRANQDISKSLSLLNDKNDFVITVTKTNRSPWFNMVKKK